MSFAPLFAPSALSRHERLAISIYALGAIGLGVTGIAFADFALQWQPVPPDLPARKFWAVMCGVAMLSGGIAFIIPRLTLLAAIMATAFDGLWLFVLKVPAIFLAPTSLIAWLGVAEIAAIALGAAMIYTIIARRPRLARGVRMTFGACAVVFGLSHFIYAGFTAAMVPPWLPSPLAWAYATGAGHLLAGLALITGIQARLAATMLSAMCAAFVILLHLPRVMAAPTVHGEWVMLFVALSICGAAAVMRFTSSAERVLV